jgi:DNA-binding transcriptional LysR family regulator
MMVMTQKHNAPIDLNLLVVFDAVMAELNVTRAAEALSMTQPAVSKALGRLRRIFNDDLFIKVPSGVKPTPKASELWLAIRDGLAQIRQATQPSSFDPATSTATLTLAMNDYVAFLLVPLLVQHLEQHAPGIDLRLIPSTNINTPTLLEQSEIDLAIGWLPDAKGRLRTHTLFIEHYVCAMRRGHPLARKKLTLEKFIQAKQLLITLTGEPVGFIDQILQEKGLQRRIAVTVNQFALAPEIVASSNLIAAINTRTIQKSGLENRLHVTPLPFDLKPIYVKMMWHERSTRNPLHIWLRTLIAQVCESI